MVGVGRAADGLAEVVVVVDGGGGAAAAAGAPPPPGAARAAQQLDDAAGHASRHAFSAAKKPRARSSRTPRAASATAAGVAAGRALRPPAARAGAAARASAAQPECFAARCAGSCSGAVILRKLISTASGVVLLILLSCAMPSGSTHGFRARYSKLLKTLPILAFYTF